MNTKQLLAGIVGALMLLCMSAVADYSADQPFTQYQRGMTYGDLVYVAAPPGGSAYVTLDSIALNTMSQDLVIDIPDGATIITARLYNYYTWSTSDYRDTGEPGDPAEANITFNGEKVTCKNPVTFTNTIDYGNGVVQYWDTKGQGYWDSTYDYPSGTFAWDVTDIFVDGLNNATITNADSSPTSSGGDPLGNEAFTTYGFGLLVVYDIEPVGPHPEKSHYWILEGADILYGNKWWEYPDDCIAGGFFGGGVPQFNKPDNTRSAELTTVVVSVNTENWASVSLNNNFLGYCSNVGDESIAVDTFDVCPIWELQKTGNFVEIQDSGDYSVPSNAFLVVNYY